MSDHVTIYTDGACSGNPGPGGWGALLVNDGREKELCGGEPDTTNNRMELKAAIEALRFLQVHCRIDLHTDSNYLRQGITEWLPGWKRKGWRTANGHPVKNQDLWMELEQQAHRHQVTWHWVKGHAGHPGNERADLLANQGLRRGCPPPSQDSPTPFAKVSPPEVPTPVPSPAAAVSSETLVRRYTLRVAHTFAASHALRGYDGDCARMHGHNWQVELFVTATTLDKVGIAVDFKVVKQTLRDILATLDHHHLNDLPPFQALNATAENIAAHIYGQAAQRLLGCGGQVSKVRVWETENSYCDYEELTS